MHFLPKFLQKRSPYFFHGAFAPSITWSRHPCQYLGLIDRCLLGIGCKLDYSARTYRGQIRSTVSGRMCQHWSAQTPHSHDFKNNTAYADGSVQRAENFCRNPDPTFFAGAWCYTMDSSIRWELCDVPMCLPIDCD